MGEPICIDAPDERSAISLLHELIGFTRTDLIPGGGGRRWQVLAEAAGEPEPVLAQVLRAVERWLASRGLRSTTVHFAGRDYLVETAARSVRAV